jgi:sugar lactone lactonase YvrE
MSFENVFDTGGGQADSAKQSAQALNSDTPGAGDISGAVRNLENQRDPWLVRQTAHGAFDAMSFLNPLFQKFQDVSATQRQVSEDPSSTSQMASSTMKAFGSPNVKISDEDMPKIEDLSKIIGNRRSFMLIGTGLGASEGLAVDPSLNMAYIADRIGRKLTALDLTTGAQRVAASSLGDIGDVKVDGNGRAYTTDFTGGRLLAVNLSSGPSSVVAAVPGAYGVALDGTGKAYVVSYSTGQLISVDLQSGQTNTAASGLGLGISGVALDGKGKAYVGQKDGGGKLYEVNLADGTNRVVTTLTGASTIRVALDGAGKAYTIDHLGGRLYEVTLADGAQRVVAFGLGTCEGLALDTVHGYIYVSNLEGQLWQLSLSAVQALGGVGKVA